MASRSNLATGAAVLVLLGACRGGISEKPPIHPVLDMDFQPKLEAQEASTFEGWPDNRGMRLPVEGTIARGGWFGEPEVTLATYDADGDGALDRVEAARLKVAQVFAQADRDENGAVDLGELRYAASLFRYRTEDGGFVAENPLPAAREVLERGRERFEIHCSVCHGVSGRGGVVAERWPTKVPDLAADEDEATRQRILAYSHGQLFDIITNGYNTMPGYVQQIDASDRWAIAHYLKALQQYFNE